MLTRFRDLNDWPFGARTAFRPAGAFDLLRHFDQILGDPDFGYAESEGAFPRISLDDQGAAFVVRAELPGLSEKDLELNATATTLTLKGERKVVGPEGYSVHRNERSAFHFARSFELPTKDDADKVEARLEHGVLTVTLPKVPEAQPKQISVKAS